MLGQSSTEASGLLQAAPAAPIFTTEPVLVLAPHAQLGRRISISFSLVFLFGFHGALLVTALLNWRAPCDRPLHVFLVAFSLVGLVASAVYFVLEVALKREPSGLPGAGEAEPAWQPKMLVTGLLVAALASGAFGAVSLASSPACHLTAPILYKWSLAAVVAFGIFCSLVVAVPLLAVVMPAAAVCLGPLIMALAACAEWMHTAGQRGPFGTVTSLQRLLGLGIDPESRPPMAPTSNFALFVNTCAAPRRTRPLAAAHFGAILRPSAQFFRPPSPTSRDRTALCWLFTFFLLEVRKNWDLPCDAPLHVFVGAVAALGLALSLADFFHDVFKDPMPPTRAEQAALRSSRKRRAVVYGWLLLAVLVWGALGTLWVRTSTQCARTAPQLYRLALLTLIAYAALVTVICVVIVMLALDFCCSGRLRMVVVFEQK